MSKPETMMIDDVKYIREDSVRSTPGEENGLRYAIVRSRNQGVMAGFVQGIDGQRVTLLKARQLWRWSSKFVLPDLAEHGLTTTHDPKLSCETSQPVEMLEACGVLYCSDKAMKSIRGWKATEND